MIADLELKFMDATRQVGMGDDNHRYSWNGNGPWPGVTAITGWQDGLNGSGGLTTWAAKIAAEAVHNLGTDAPFMSLEEVTAEALRALNRQRNIGSAVHGKVADLRAGKAWTRTPDTGLYLDGYSLFMAQEHPESIYSEQVVLSPSRSYGGRFDEISKLWRHPDGTRSLRPRTAMIDTKTGKIKKSHTLQLCLYEDADFIGKPDDPTQYPIPRIQDFYVLLLREGSYELVPITVTNADKRHARELTKMFHRARAWEKGA